MTNFFVIVALDPLFKLLDVIIVSFLPRLCLTLELLDENMPCFLLALDFHYAS
jgi:hypothetical protein